jgi:thiol-disulfide isomerase/thioredoxin
MRNHRFTNLATALALILVPVNLGRAAVYQAGDQVANFSLVNRATGAPVQLTDFAGQIVLFDWFAWWCPFCQAAAPQLLEGIDEWYAERGGNPAGIPVLHVGVNLQPNQETQTENFVSKAQLELVLEDFDRAIAGLFAASGQPIFAIINGVTNSPTHDAWELLYSRMGYGERVFPVDEFRAAIDAVQAAEPEPPAPPTLYRPEITSDARFLIRATGPPGAALRIESSSDLILWETETTFTTVDADELVEVQLELRGAARYYRVTAP